MNFSDVAPFRIAKTCHDPMDAVIDEIEHQSCIEALLPICTDREREFLSLIAGGDTEEAVSKQMGLSPSRINQLKHAVHLKAQNLMEQRETICA